MTKKLMNILNLSSLPASIKVLSNMNGRLLNPEKRKWKISARTSLKMRDVKCVKNVLVALPKNAKIVNKSKLNLEKRKKNEL